MFQALLISWSLSLGLVPTMSDAVGTTYADLDPTKTATYAEFALSATAWDRLTVSGSIGNYQYYSGDKYFYPFRVDYKAGIQFRIIDGLTIEANHECDHPISYETNGKTSYPFNMARTIVSVTFSGSSHLGK